MIFNKIIQTDSFVNIAFLCIVKRFSGFILAVVIGLSMASAQQYHMVDYGRSGNIPAAIQGVFADEDDISAEADGDWKLWMGSSTAPDRSSPLVLGFGLTIDGVSYTHVRAASNGYITFDTAAAIAPILGAATLPLSSLPSPSLYFGGLFLSGSNDRLLYRMTGSAPNRALWIKWYSASEAIPGKTYAYASAVIMENGTLWTGLLHTGSNAANYQTPALSFGFQRSASEAHMMYGAPNMKADSGMYTTAASDNRFAAYIPGAQASWDAQWIEFPKKIYATLGKPAIFEARIANTGSRSFSHVELEYRINGGAGILKKNIAAQLDTLNRVGIIRDTLSQPSDTGVYNLEVRFSKYDGNPAAAPRPISLSYILDQGKRVPRRSLAEMQTASWCSVCPAEFKAMRNLESAHQAVTLFHHVSDGMAHQDFSNLGVQTVPAFSINGHVGTVADTGSWHKQIQQASSDGAPCSIKVLNATLSSSNNMSFDVETRFADLYQGDLRLFGALRERTVRGGGLPFDQFIAPEIRADTASPYYNFPNQAGGFKHPDVAWYFFTPYRGTTTYMPAGTYRGGNVYSRSFSLSMPAVTSVLIPASAPYPDANSNAAGRYKPAEKDIVAVLWDHSNPMQPQVVQATVQPLWDAANNIAEKQENRAFMLWPNPTRNQIQVYFPQGIRGNGHYDLLDASGRVCLQGKAEKSEFMLELQQLKPGVYWFVAEGQAQKVILSP